MQRADRSAGSRSMAGAEDRPAARVSPARTEEDGAAGRFPPISDYAVVGDCRTVAAIARNGAIEWLCLPHFSSPSVFAAILDRQKGGTFAISPRAPFTVERRYVEDTNVLRTVFRTETGTAWLTDLMVLPDDQELLPEHELLRRVEGIEGHVDFSVRYEPRPGYGCVRPRLERRGRLGWRLRHADMALWLHTDFDLTPDESGSTLSGSFRATAGARFYASLCYSRREPAVIPPLGTDADRRALRTERWWQGWTRRCAYQGQYQEAVRRSLLTMKALTHAASGAMVASATTSLPEGLGGERIWDYRYCWIRDSGLVLRCFVELGYREEAEAYLTWILHTTRLARPHLKVLYDVFGEFDLPERSLDHLTGYRCSGHSRIGNQARWQTQNDVYGAVITAAYEYVANGGQLESAEKRMLVSFGRTVASVWREPDHSIWEIPGQPRQYVYTKLLCWVALDRLLCLHRQGVLRVPYDEFAAECAAIRRTIMTEGCDPGSGAFAGVLGDSALDSALLLMPSYGFIDASAPRMMATYDRIVRRLGARELLYRYDPGSDGLPGREGAFTFVSLAAVDCLARAGRIREAEARLEAVLELRSDVGLLAEEYDPATGRALGNMPQAISHVGLVNAALALDSAHRREHERGRA